MIVSNTCDDIERFYLLARNGDKDALYDLTRMASCAPLTSSVAALVVFEANEKKVIVQDGASSENAGAGSGDAPPEHEAILARCALALLVFRGCSAVHPNPKEACEVLASSSIISGIRSITDAAASSMTSPAQESIRAYGQLLFARLLLDGVGCDRDFKKAFALTEESSKQSIPNAVSTLAFFYQTGLGGAVSQDVAKAIELYEQGIEMGSTQAMVNLGHMLEKGGPGIVRNVGRATELFERAVDQGDIMAMNFLGNIVQNGIAGSKDANRAYELFSMSGRRGNVLAQVNAGLCLQNGIGCKKDLEEAARFFQMAHEAGSPHGSALLGYFYARGEGGYEKDVVKARELFEKGVAVGIPDAFASLASLYERGRGVDKDIRKAEQLYLEAANKGHVASQVQLGVLYGSTGCVIENPNKAVQYLVPAVNRGHAVASYYLAHVLIQHAEHFRDLDIGTKKTPLELLKEAADMYQHRESSFELGQLYEIGNSQLGVTEDLSLAKHYYEIGSRKGYQRSIDALARLNQSD